MSERLKPKEVIGGFSALDLMLDGKHSLEVLAEPLKGCESLSAGITHLMALPDIAFGGWMLYAAVFLAVVVGLACGGKSLIDRMRSRAAPSPRPRESHVTIYVFPKSSR